MSITEIVRTSAQQANERRLSALAEKLEVVRTMEVLSDELKSILQSLATECQNMQSALAMSTDQQADRMMDVVRAMERLAKSFHLKLSEGIQEAGQSAATIRETRAEMVQLLTDMRSAHLVMSQSIRRDRIRMLLTMATLFLITVPATSFLSAMLVLKTLGYALPWPL